MNEILLYVFSGMAFLSTLFMLFSRNILYSALALVVTLVCVAGLFVLFNAEFVAVAQLMIYVGGIIVLMLFAIMLTSNGKRNKLITLKYRFLPAMILGAALYAFLAMLFYTMPAVPVGPLPARPVHALGVYMLSDFLIPVEILAVLLLVVLVGALTIAQNYYKRNPRRT